MKVNPPLRYVSSPTLLVLSPANFTREIRFCLLAGLLAFSSADLSMKLFTAPFSFSIFLTPSLSVSSILPDTSSTSTISSGTVVCPIIFAVEDNADNPTRKSDLLPFSIVADAPTLFVNSTFPVDTDLSVQIRPTFFVLSSSASESCHLLMVTLSATVVFAAAACHGKSPHTRNPAMTTANADAAIRLFLFRFQKSFMLHALLLTIQKIR